MKLKTALKPWLSEKRSITHYTLELHLYPRNEKGEQIGSRTKRYKIKRPEYLLEKYGDIDVGSLRVRTGYETYNNNGKLISRELYVLVLEDGKKEETDYEVEEWA